jgi:hypothetical protein
MPDEQTRAITERFEKELIERASQGDAEAGREILTNIALRIDQKDYDSPLFPYLAGCLWNYVHDGIPLDRALSVEAQNIGGRPPHDHTALAAVDILLCDYSGYGRDGALAWIEEHIGVHKRTMRRIRRRSKSFYQNKERDKEDLLHLSGDYRQKVAEVLPQT